MSDKEKTTPKTELELNDLIAEAVQSGDDTELDRLMAVELEEEEEVLEELPEDAEEKSLTKEGTSEGVEVKKEEAANKTAASTPEEGNAVNKEDEVATLKQELHKLKSDAGRMPYVQSRMKELERELREVKLSRNVGVPNGSSTDPEKLKTVEVPQNLKKRIEELRDVDPSLADLLEDMVRVQRSENQETATRVVTSFSESEREQNEQRVLDEQYALVVSDIPWAPDAFKSQEWKQWKDGLTPGKRALAESLYADDVKIALGAFAQDMQARNPQAAQVPSPQGVLDPEAEKIKQNRERKLATTGAVKAPTAKAGLPVLDEEALFKEHYERIQKENHLK